MGIKDPEARRVYMRDYFRRLYAERIKLIHEHLGGKCCRCERTDKLRIVDSIKKPRDKRFDLKKHYGRKVDVVLKLIRQCKLYCPDHYKEVRSEIEKLRNRVWRHGTWYSAYKKKCDCEECANYRTEYALWRQEQRRERREQAGLPPALNTKRRKRIAAQAA